MKYSKFYKNILTDFIGILTVFTLWYLLALIVDENFVPFPGDVVINFFKSLPILIEHSISSMYRLFYSIFLSLFVGVIFGILLGTSKIFDKLLSPFVYVMYPVPKSAFLPIFIVLLGLDDASKIALIFSIVVLQIVITTRDAVNSIDNTYFYSAKLLGLNKLGIYREVILPAITPKALTALRLSIGTGIAVLFFSENFATTEGIGYYIQYNWNLLKYTDMYTGILTLSIIGYLLFKILDLLESILCRWR